MLRKQKEDREVYSTERGFIDRGLARRCGTGESPEIGTVFTSKLCAPKRQGGDNSCS